MTNFSFAAFLIVAEEEFNSYNQPEKPRTRPIKRKKKKVK